MKLKRLISKSLVIGLLFNYTLTSFAGVLSEDGRYEMFEGNNIIIDDIQEEDKVDIEIEGNTLVNLHKKQKYYFLTSDSSEKYIKEEKDNYVKVEILEDLSGWFFFNLGELNLDLIKPNSVYTICFEKIINIDEIKLCYRDAQGNIGEQYFYDVKNNKVIINTRDFKKEDLSDDVILYGLTSCTQGKEIEVSNAMIFEGILEDEDIPKEYFEGMKSVGNLENDKYNINLKSTNKNLFNLDNWKDINIWDSTNGSRKFTGIDYDEGTVTITGAEQQGSYLLTGASGLDFVPETEKKYLIPIKPDTFYTVSYTKSMNSVTSNFCQLYDANYNTVASVIDIGDDINNLKANITFRTTNDSRYLGVRFGLIENQNTTTYSNIQIEECGFKTEYERFNNDDINLLINEPLRALPNGVKDKIIKKNGKWHVERNCKELILDGSDDEGWLAFNNVNGVPSNNILTSQATINATQYNMIYGPILNSLVLPYSYEVVYNDIEGIFYDGWGLYIGLSKDKLKEDTLEGFKQYLSENPITLVYPLATPIYEPINIDLSIQLFEGMTHISNNSNIPATMEITIDRTINRAVEAIELAKVNPTIENISLARMWTNLLKETINKDELQSEINNITDIQDLQLEKKAVSANVDIYIKSENSLSMTLSTNSIMFEDYSGVSDIEKLNALEITVNSSLPYDLNAYLESEIQNSDKSTTIDSNLLQIKESSNLDYKTFNNTTDKVILEEDCPSGNYNKHNIDLKMEGSNAYKADVYKTVIKFEAEQK